MINKALDVIFWFTGPKRDKIKKPKKKVFFYMNYRMARIMFKRRGIFLGLMTIYILTFGRLIDRIFTTYKVELSDEEKHQFIINKTNAILNATRS